MIERDISQRYDPDCSTCAHRAERHPSKRERPDRPRIMRFVCMVEGRAICEHGTRMLHSAFHENGALEQSWKYECPCKFYDKKNERWVALDWEER